MKDREGEDKKVKVLKREECKGTTKKQFKESAVILQTFTTTLKRKSGGSNRNVSPREDNTTPSRGKSMVSGILAELDSK